MAERIPHNPQLEALSNHTGPHYNDICLLLLNAGLTMKQAVQSLNKSWTRTCEERIQAWDQQVINDRDADKEAQHLQQEEEQQNIENECLEVEKKRLKMNNFEDAAMVSSYIASHPSQYALCIIPLHKKNLRNFFFCSDFARTAQTLLRLAQTSSDFARKFCTTLHCPT